MMFVENGLQYDVLVIGAGAAGMMCAAVAGQAGKRVLGRVNNQTIQMYAQTRLTSDK